MRKQSHAARIRPIFPALAVTLFAIGMATVPVQPSMADSWVDARKLAGRTVVTYGGGHGTQVEYFSKHDCWLWYPGNRRSLHCKWKTTKDGRRICFRYDGTTFNPVTKKVSRNAWQCRPANQYAVGIERSCSGDVFKLASGRLPYTLKKGRAQLRKILRSCQ